MLQNRLLKPSEGKPNLFIPGFPKSGTSSLHSMLIEHPEISGGPRKEPHTYSWDNFYKRRFGYFRKYYAGLGSNYILDSSTSYMVSEKAVGRIRRDNPNAKFILVARNPVDRIISHYNWLSALGFIDKPFFDEIRAHEGEKFDYRNHYGGNFKAYIDFSLYGEQLKRLIENFGTDSFLWFTYEDIFSNWQRRSEEILDFLDLQAMNLKVQKKNTTPAGIKKDQDLSIPGRVNRRLQYEWKILRGYPRGKKKFPNARTIRVEKSLEITTFLMGYLENDLKVLGDLGVDLSPWQSSNFLD